MAAGGAAVGLVLLFMLAGHPERLGVWAGKLARHLPARAAKATENLVRTFAEGLLVMRHPGQLLLAAFWSVPLWVSIALGVWLTSLAFDLTFPFLGSFLVLALLAAGVSLPTPGGVGGFHYTYLLALTQFFGAPKEASAAAAMVLHAVSFVPVTILGPGLHVAGWALARAPEGDGCRGEKGNCMRSAEGKGQQALGRKEG